jgi:hypothetical protein
MLSTQVNSAIQTDILPTQNIARLDQTQPQIYSLLANTNSPSSTKPPRRKKTTKVDDTIPVMINPQITRTPTGVAFDSPYHRSTIVPDSLAPLMSTCLLNGHPLPFRFHIDHNSYDANNNIHHNRVPSPSMSLNSSSSTQAQQISTWPNGSLPGVNPNLLSQTVLRSQLFGINQLLNNNISERTVSGSSPKQNEYKPHNPTFSLTDQGSMLGHSHSLPSPLASASTSAVPPVKPKRSKKNP